MAVHGPPRETTSRCPDCTKPGSSLSCPQEPATSRWPLQSPVPQSRKWYIPAVFPVKALNFPLRYVLHTFSFTPFTDYPVFVC
jgi:hypothetical protein